MNSENIPLQKDELRESWVDLYYQACSPEKEKENNEIHASGLYTPLNIEKLLNDAQRESNSNSREASARGSPKALSSPAPELALSSHSSHSSNSQDEREEPGTDWIWDWSSGPERNPAGDKMTKYRRPRRQYQGKDQPRSLRQVFNVDNKPILTVTHTCTLVVGVVFGASLMWVILTKCARKEVVN